MILPLYIELLELSVLSHLSVAPPVFPFSPNAENKLLPFPIHPATNVYHISLQSGTRMTENFPDYTVANLLDLPVMGRLGIQNLLKVI